MLKVTNSYVGGGPKFVLRSKFANTCTKGQQKTGVVLWYQPLFLTCSFVVVIVSFAMGSTAALPKSVHAKIDVTKSVSRLRDDAERGELSRLHKYFVALFEAHGPQHWWPGRSRFEVIVGAILTQSTSWANVEAAIANLRKARLLTPGAMHAIPAATLARLIRPSGYFRQKAEKLKAFVDFLFGEYIVPATTNRFEGDLPSNERRKCTIRFRSFEAPCHRDCKNQDCKTVPTSDIRVSSARVSGVRVSFQACGFQACPAPHMAADANLYRLASPEQSLS